MIKNFILQSVFGLSALMACASYAEDKNYVQLSSGYSFAKPTGADIAGKKPKRGNVYSIEIGRSVTDRVKVGLEFSHRSGYSVRDYNEEYVATGLLIESHSIKWSYKSSAAMINFRYDVANLNGFTPYVLIGAGIAQNKMKETLSREGFIPGIDNSAESNAKKVRSFAYKVGAGIHYSVNSKVGIDIRYQFVNLGRMKLHNFHDNQGNYQNARRGKLKSNEVLLGVSYKF